MKEMPKTADTNTKTSIPILGKGNNAWGSSVQYHLAPLQGQSLCAWMDHRPRLRRWHYQRDSAKTVGL